MAAMLANDAVGQRSGIMPLAGLARSQKKRKVRCSRSAKKLGNGWAPAPRSGEASPNPPKPSPKAAAMEPVTVAELTKRRRSIFMDITPSGAPICWGLLSLARCLHCLRLDFGFVVQAGP